MRINFIFIFDILLNLKPILIFSFISIYSLIKIYLAIYFHVSNIE